MAYTKKSDIEFFGAPDRNVRGEISSSIPAWMLTQHVDELEESVNMKRRALDQNRIPADSRPYMESELKDEEARLKEIKASAPKLTGPQKDEVAKARQLLADQIRETAPSLRDDRNGFVKPHDEYRRLKTPHIKIDATMANALGMKTQGGKITGDQANRAYKILSAAIGEDGSPERLRRDFGQTAYRTEDPMTQEILKNGR